MNSSLNKILQNYLHEKKSPLGNNWLANYIRRDAIKAFATKAKIDLKKYSLKGSAGQTNWADVPWVAVFDKDITKTATKGYDIVYLFRKDMSGVYISLNQGWTYFKEKYGTKEGRLRIKQVSDAWKSILSSTLTDFSFDSISLGKKTDLSEGYELGHICGKFYDAANIPTDDVLVNDLRNLMGVYRELKGRLNNLSIEATNDRLITEVELGLIDISYGPVDDKSGEDSINDDILISGNVGHLVEVPVTNMINYNDAIPDFKPRKTNFLKKSRNQKKLGHAGELLVLKYEKEKLIAAGRPDLVERVRHVSYLDGDGAGYDILSIDENENLKYIEVKTTTKDEKTPFIITKQEVMFSEIHSQNYYLHRVFNFKAEESIGDFFVLCGNLNDMLVLDPLQYTVAGINNKTSI